MFADEVRRAIEAAPRTALPAITAAMWKAYTAGQVSEAEAEALSALIEIRQSPSVPSSETSGSSRRRVGSRPRSDASMERRRRWALAGRIPAALGARFTQAEAAVLAVVAVETVKGGDCRLAVGHLAAVAGVSETTVRNTLRRARDLGLVTIEERRLAAWRSDTNVVSIVSREWLAWLRLGRQAELRTGGGSGKWAAAFQRHPEARTAHPKRDSREGDPDAVVGAKLRSPRVQVSQKG